MTGFFDFVLRRLLFHSILASGIHHPYNGAGEFDEILQSAISGIRPELQAGTQDRPAGDSLRGQVQRGEIVAVEQPPKPEKAGADLQNTGKDPAFKLFRGNG